jgi:hypothetical protein
MRFYKLLILLILSISAFPKAAAFGAAEPDSATKAEMMRKAMEAILPGPQHRMLERLSGSWKIQIKTWPAPNKQPVVSEATATNILVLGGRFLQSTWSGKLMGMPAENLTVLGFDRRTGQYTAVVFDTFGTYYVTAAGDFNSADSTITFRGHEDQSSLGHEHDFEFTLTFAGPDRYIWSVIFKDPVTSSGTGNFKMMELTFARTDSPN